MESEIIISGVSIAILLVFSAIFSGSETALTVASRARLLRLMRDSHTKAGRRARLVNNLTEDKERLIGGILLGNNLVNILASALATGVFIGLFGDAGIYVATLAMTALVLVFAEVLPKSYAIANPDRMALLVSPFINVIVRFLSPVVRAVQFIVRLTLRLFGIELSKAQSILSAQEELRGTLELHAQEGSMVKHERDMLSGILDLSEVDVSEIMVHRRSSFMIDAALPTPEILEKLVESPHTRIPLWRDDSDNIVGILHTKDVLRAVRKHDGPLQDLDVAALAKKPLFVPETTTLREQLNSFRRLHAHIGMVVDEYGSIMGLVTLEDILEEVVGEIADEHDIAEAGIRTGPDGSVIVKGTVTIRDLNRQFDWELPDDPATTIAGLIIHEARTIPEARQTFSFHGFKFDILRRERNQLTLLRIVPDKTDD